MPESLSQLLNLTDAWMLKVFLVILATGAVAYGARWVLAYIERRIAQTHTVWDDAALAAARSPLQALVWVLGLDMAAHVIVSATGAELFSYSSTVRGLLIIVLLCWFLLRFIREAEARLTAPTAGKVPVDATTARAIVNLLRMTVMITGGLILLEKMGYSVSGVLAFGGIGGIAVGFAAKDLLANFFGGLMIFLDRPFSIGDWVRSPDRNIEGTVECIGWRLTRIRTFDKRPLYVPNATFTSIAVENPSRMTHRRIHETIGIRYDDWLKLPAIVEEVKKMLSAHQEIDQTQTMIINFDRFNESSLDFFVYVFTHTKNWVEFHAVKQDVLFRIMQIVDAHGAEVAFPTRTLHIASGEGLPG